MSDALAEETHERFALAYATLELADPGNRSNGWRAYEKAQPDCARKTAMNQANNLLAREDVRARVDQLLAQAEGAEHLIHAPAFIDDLLLDAAVKARADGDAATMMRIAELADRGRVGGARYVKETRNRRVAENELSGKSPREIRAMRKAALAELGVDVDAFAEFEKWRKMRQIEAKTDGEGAGEDAESAAGVGAADRAGDPVH